MMEFAKDLASNLSCALADFAKVVGSGTVDAAKSVGGNTADAAKFVGGKSADAAKLVGEATVDLAKRIGPKRGLIGLAAFGAAIAGGVYLTRYLRARAAAADAEGSTGSKDARATKAARRNAAQSITH
jgi:hypothetical protein